jgi:DedD protein
MREGNVRVRERFELSLDGRQIAATVAGALVLVAVVFVLGLNVGRQMAHRQLELARGGDLDALDLLPAATRPVPADKGGEITFYDRLPKGKPIVPPPDPRPAVVSAPAAQATLAAAPAAPAAAAAPAQAAPVAIPSAADGRIAAAALEPAPQAASTAPAAPLAAPRPTAPMSAFTVQLSASADRAETDRLAARFRSLGARVETADVPGKGRFYRVRVGSFATRAEAEQRLRELARDSGAKGYVASLR